MKSLFIGRFQPLHKGHLQIIKNVHDNYDEIIIGIGSSQYNHTLCDPFTAEERKLMIEKSLDEINVRNYRIVLIPDIHNYPKWAPYVVSIIPDFEVVLSNSPIVKRLFSERGYTVRETSLYDRSKYSGREIRRRMVNDIQWEDLVPEPVMKIIKEVDGVRRLKELSKS